MNFFKRLFLNFYFLLSLFLTFSVTLSIFIRNDIAFFITFISLVFSFILFTYYVASTQSYHSAHPFPRLQAFKRNLLRANEIYFCTNDECKKLVRYYHFSFNSVQEENESDFVCLSCEHPLEEIEQENIFKWMGKHPDFPKISLVRFLSLYFGFSFSERSKIKRIKQSIEHLAEIKTFLEFQSKENFTFENISTKNENILSIEENLSKELEFLQKNVESKYGKNELQKIQNKLNLKFYDDSKKLPIEEQILFFD